MFLTNMMLGVNSNRNNKPAGSGEIELELVEAYISDKDNKVARLDRESMKVLNISSGHSVIIFGDDQPVVLKALPLFPSDKRSGVIRISKGLRKQLKRTIGDKVNVRGIGKSNIDKVVNYLLLDKLSNEKQ